MNSKMFVLLLVILVINTLRYGSYLLEASTSTYYLLSFCLNLFALIGVILSNIKGRIKNTDGNGSTERKQRLIA